MKIADLGLGKKLAALAGTSTFKWCAGIVVSAFVAHQTGTISFSDALLASVVAGAQTLGRYSDLKKQDDPTNGSSTSPDGH